MYGDISLQFVLNSDEIKLLDKVWNFMDCFNKTKITRSKYRTYIINKIKKTYSIDEFYKYEIIVEKMYWNLSKKLSEMIKCSSNDVFEDTILNKNKIINKIFRKNNKITESNIKKSFIIINDFLHYKYDYCNDTDLLLFSIMSNRSIYESLMSNSVNIYDINELSYNNTIEFDYPYPNLNTMKCLIGDKNERIKNIHAMYYEYNSEINWFVY